MFVSTDRSEKLFKGVIMETVVSPQIPQWVIYLVGTLVIANFGTIIGIVWFFLKASWFLSAKNSEFTYGITEAKEIGVRAHKRQDSTEQDIKAQERRIDGLELKFNTK